MASKKAILPPDFTATELTGGNVSSAMKAIEAKKGDLFRVPMGQLTVIEGFNPRVRGTDGYEAGIRELADSIKQEGFYSDKPLAGFVDDEGRICITDGHRRFAAAQLAVEEGAEIETLPVIVKPQGTSLEDLTVALVRSNTGKPLSAYELAIVVKRLQGYGVEKEKIAEKLGMTPRYIDDLLILIGANKSIRDMVINDQVAATLAIDELRRNPKEALERLKAGLAKAQEKGKRKVTAKHMEKKPKKAKAKAKAAASGEPEEEEEVIELSGEESRFSGVLDAIEVLENEYNEADNPLRKETIEGLQRTIIATVGRDGLLDVAIKLESYERTGLARMGFVVVEETTEGGESADPTEGL